MSSRIRITAYAGILITLLFGGMVIDQAYAAGEGGSDKSAVKVIKHITIKDPAITADEKWEKNLCTAKSLSEQSDARIKRGLEGRPYVNGVTPVWSRDGKLLATNLSIWKMLPGKDPTRILALKDGAWPVGFTSDGKELAYLKFKYEWSKSSKKWRSHQQRLLPDLYIVTIKSKAERRITENVLLASWSPSGERFAVLRPNDASAKYDGRFQGDSEIALHIVDRKGKEDRKIAVLEARDNFLALTPPAWSSDGRRIAFDDEGEIWLVKADGTGLRKLVRRIDYFFSPSELDAMSQEQQNKFQHFTFVNALVWTPDQQRLQFLWAERLIGIPYSPQRLASADVSTGKVTFLSDDLAAELVGVARSGAWSPDQSRVAFLVDRTWYKRINPGSQPMHPQFAWMKPEFAKLTGIWAANSNGTRLHQAVKMLPEKDEKYVPMRGIEPWRAYQATPAWSPDGKMIAAVVPWMPEMLNVLVVE